MNFFDKLRQDTNPEQAYLLSTPQIKDGLRGEISLDTYIAYLTEAYHHVKHTVPLMTAAKAKLAPSQKWLEAALDEYVTEEQGHEQWILNDISASGGDADRVRKGEPQPATEFMVAYAYDYINRINPVGFFGMVLVLEGTSTQLATRGSAAIQSALKLPDQAFSYLTSHGSLDLEHMKFFESLMNRIDNLADQQAITHMARRMYILFANMFSAIPHKSMSNHDA